MPLIEELFMPHNARAKGFDSYDHGDVAYVTNGLRNNGVVGYIRPRSSDTVFDFMGIVLSTFCEATVQLPPFVARGNGGSGLMVLQPRKSMTGGQLAQTCAFINSAIRWRFNWYRQATIDRIRVLQIPEPSTSALFGVGRFVESSDVRPQPSDLSSLRFKAVPLRELFEMRAGEYHNAGDLPPGRIPLISCGDMDNGIMSFVSVPEADIHQNQITIAFNGDTLTTKFHPYRFAAKDDVAVCSPKHPLRLSTLLFVQLMMAREKWRYSYYRKCFMEKLERQCVSLPIRGDSIDEIGMESAMHTTRYWDVIKARME